MKRLLLTLLAAAAGALCAVAIGACGDDDDQVTADADQEVSVRITDTALYPDRVEISPGTIRFRIDNDGDQPHRLAVETPNGAEQTGTIDPDARGSVIGDEDDDGSLTVELVEGEYAMYDPQKDYRERGVEGVVVVSGNTDTVERTAPE